MTAETNDTVKTIGVVVAVVLALLGSTLLGAAKYNALDERVTTHLSEDAMDKLREEHRLTIIEQQLKRTNEILEEIRDTLKQSGRP